MTADSIIEHDSALRPNYVPETFIDRGDERQAIDDILDRIGSTPGDHLLLQGPRGTGKTHLVHHRLEAISHELTPCYIDCREADTQYKALQRLHGCLTQETPKTGFHTADLQRKIETRLQATPTVIVLDELDFLLMNDGDDLLYTLTRVENAENVGLILISSSQENPLDHVDQRTRSSLSTQHISMEPYPADTIYEILVSRGRTALEPHSARRNAITYISSIAPNAAIAIHWLREAAASTTGALTETVATQTREQAVKAYRETLLDPFTGHHELLYHVIKDLTENGAHPVQTGEVYDHYHEQCTRELTEPLSDRRISDYIKHLELLDLITADYHYGGSQGKTRKIQLKHPFSDYSDREGQQTLD